MFQSKNMVTVNDLNAQIMNITIQIHEHYPELYRNLNEMAATIPVADGPVIDRITLENWRNALTMLVIQYKSVRQK